MKNYGRVSIIVPIYNVELYIERCIDSIVRQTYKDIEILLIDDGSTDRSSELCDLWAKKDNRIKVVHQRNRGLPGARETGVQRSSGKYVMFVDSDDWIAETTVQDAAECAFVNEADIVFYDFYKTTQSQFKKPRPARESFPKGETVTGEEALRRLFLGKLNWNVWQLFIRRRIFQEHNIVFPVGVMMGEDMGITCQLLGESKLVTFLSHAYYFYFQRDDSSVHSFKNEEQIISGISDVWRIQGMMEEYTKRNHPELLKAWNFQSVWHAFSDLCLINGSGSRNLDLLQIRDFLEKHIDKHYALLKPLRRKDRIRIFLVQSKILRIRFISNKILLYIRNH